MEFPIKVFLLLLIIAYVKCLPAGEVAATAHIDAGFAGGFNKEFNVSAIVGQKILLPEAPRSRGRESAILEQPNLIAQKDSIYDNAQQVVINFFHPKPIIDTIQEHEKYGNNGDQFRSIGNKIVEGYEGFSNFLNAAVEIPFEAMKQVTRKASSYLGVIGAKLVGL